MVAGCAPRELPRGPGSLRELERLALVADASHVMTVEDPSGAIGYPTFELSEPLLVDRFETTRRDWLAWLESGAAPRGAERACRAEDWPEDELGFPATFVTLAEAQAFAAWRGMRLLRAEEWVLVAIGPRKNPYPWGFEFQDSIANTLDLGLGRACPVGTFPAGSTAAGIFDMLGNVAEWCSDRLPGQEFEPGGASVSVLGGSYLTWARRTYGERRFPLAARRHPAERDDDVGLRCAVDARSFVRDHAAGWLGEPGASERLRAIGAHWGRPALRILEGWRAEPELAGHTAALAAVELLIAGASR